MKLSNRVHVFFLCLTTALLLGGCGKPSFRPDPAAIEAYSAFLDAESPYVAVGHLSLPGSHLVSSVDPTGGNDDYGHFLRSGPEGWAVAADLQGPGVLTRFWFTGAHSGEHRIRFYFDDEAQPRVDTTVGEWCGGTPMMAPPLGAYEQYCWYNLLPIPFASRLVVMIEQGGATPDGGLEKIYYQLNWRKAAAGEVLPVFPVMVDKARLSTSIRAFAARMDKEASSNIPTNVVKKDFVLAPRAHIDAPLPDGPHRITRLEISPNFDRLTSVSLCESMMRALVLSISWEGQAASVQVPLGDFFGSPWARIRFANAFFGMEGDTFFCRWPMDYDRTAVFSLQNDSDQEIPVTVSFALEGRLADQTPSYFHAVWSRSGPEDVGQAHSILNTKGRGRYVGCVLSVLSMDRSWWILEGDESISTDGAVTPQWLGTGLEDYFTGGWYYQGPLIRPWHGLIMKAPFRTIQYRLHPFDAPAFDRDIEVLMERGPDQASHGYMESAAFYYADQPQAAPPIPGPEERARPVDPVAEATLYNELNGLELLGDTRAGLDKAQAFLEWKPTFPFKDTLALRALWMRAQQEGFPAVESDFLQLRTQTRERSAQEAAGHWAWFEKDPSHALLLFFANMPGRVFLNGQIVLETAGQGQKIDVARVTLSKGSQALAVETALRAYPDWMQCRLITHDGDVCSSPDWRATYSPSSGWTMSGYDDSAWAAVGGTGVKGPPEVPYVWVEPSAFPMLPAIGLRLGGAKPPQARSVAYRTTFIWPRKGSQ